MRVVELSGSLLGAFAESAIEHYPWGRIVWLASAEIFPATEQTLGYVEIDPGSTNYRHVHPNCEEVLLVLEGTLDHLIGSETVALGPGSTLHIPQGVVHSATNTSASVARMIVAYPNGRREIDLVSGDGRLPAGAA